MPGITGGGCACIFAPTTDTAMPSLPIFIPGIIIGSSPPSTLSLGLRVTPGSYFLGEVFDGPASSSTSKMVLREPSEGVGIKDYMKSLPMGPSKVKVSIVEKLYFTGANIP
jgi:hypothetical protein